MTLDHQDSLIVLMDMKISTYVNTYGRFCTGVLESDVRELLISSCMAFCTC